jgi:3-oxoacyl-[acyl-carrier protein] reductase
VAITLTFPDGVALVAGGTGRVGAGCVERLAEAGVAVVFTYKGNEAKAHSLRDRLLAAGHRVECRRMDMAQDRSVAEAIAFACEKWGRLHTVISAGGPMIPFAKLADVGASVVTRFVEDDAIGIYRLASQAVQAMRASGGGSIVLCTTIANRRVVDFDGMSPFSKGAIEALVRQIAAEEADSHIRCNAVPISWTADDTAEEQIALISAMPSPERELAITIIRQMEAGTRMHRPSGTRDAGNLFAFLASDQAAFITGQSVAIDGGFSL